MSTEVAGVDGCRGGWVIAQFCVRSGKLRMHLEESLASFARDHACVTTFVIDMPIQLGPQPERGGRSCDREARQYLGRPAGASLFSAPSAATLARFRQHQSYRELHEAQKEAYPGAPGLSKQTYHLLPKIDEVDSFVRSHPRLRIIEGHPEVAYKKRGLWRTEVFSPKKSLRGRAAREAWARARFAQALTLPEFVRGGPRAKRDDWLDALVLADVAASHRIAPRRYFGGPGSSAELKTGRIYY